MTATPEIRRGLATLGGMVAWIMVSLACLLYCCGCSVSIPLPSGDARFALADKIEGKDAQVSKYNAAGIVIGQVVLGRIEVETSRIPKASDAQTKTTQLLNAQGQTIRTDTSTSIGQLMEEVAD